MTNTKDKTAHSFLSSDYVSLNENESVENALNFLRKTGKLLKQKKTYLYVVNSNEKLVGVLAMQELLTSNPAVPLNHIMNRSVSFLYESSSFDEIVHMFENISFFAIPVVDRNQKLIGIILAEKIRPHFDSQQNKSYSFTKFTQEEIESKKIFEIVFRRLPWLLISLTSGLICAYILGIFIGKIESIIALILFVPVVIGLSGSVGTQSAAVAGRGLNKGNLSLTSIARIIGKEFSIGALLGTIVFFVVSIVSLLWRKSIILGLALGISIALNIAISGIMGVFLAVFFHLFKIKSKYASGLFLLLICDTVALVLYFVIALFLVNPVIEIS